MTSREAFEAAVCASISEAAFTAQVIELAQWQGWRVFHARAARTAKGWRTPVQGDGVGFPDLLLIRGPQCVVTELKAERGRLTREQIDWLAAFAGAGLETHVWKPSQREAMLEVLR